MRVEERGGKVVQGCSDAIGQPTGANITCLRVSAIRDPWDVPTIPPLKLKFKMVMVRVKVRVGTSQGFWIAVTTHLLDATVWPDG